MSIIKALFCSSCSFLHAESPDPQLQSAIVLYRIAKETVCWPCFAQKCHHSWTLLHTVPLIHLSLSERLQSRSDICKVPPPNIQPSISSCCYFSPDSITDDVVKELWWKSMWWTGGDLLCVCVCVHAQWNEEKQWEDEACKREPNERQGNTLPSSVFWCYCISKE